VARLKTIREDIRVAALWHDAPFIRKRFGERGAKVAACFRSPTLQAVLLYRLQAAARRYRIPLVPSICRRLTIIIAQIEIGDAARIGPGLHINHGHVVIDGPVVIGPDCSISPFVTIGVDTGGAPDERMFGAPRIGRFVFIGTGAKLFGPITLGNNARIGANAVVMQDVPENCTAVGVPARIIPRESAFGPVGASAPPTDS
jgi:serine O-acetyltransferase